MIFSTFRRGALLLIASAIAAGPFAVVQSASADGVFSCDAGTACVHITFPDGGHSPVDVPTSVIADNADIQQQQYLIRTPNGQTQPNPITGLSVRSLLSAVIPDPIDVGSVTYTLARNPTTLYESPLQAGDLDDPSPFQNQLEPAFGLQGSGATAQIEYIRPLRSDSDVNYKDDFQTSSTTSINLQVFTQGALLHPTVEVGSGPFHVGEAIPFSATFDPSDPPHDGANFAWTWAGGDPPVPGSQSTTHTYQQDNYYYVSVSVSGSDPDGGDYYGQSPTVTVQVGKNTNPPGNGAPGGNGTGSKHHPKQGAPKGHGHHAGSHAHGGPAAGSSGSGSPSGGVGSGAAGATLPAGSSGSGASSGATTAPSPGGTSSTAPPASGGGRGDLVHGILIAGPLGGVPSAAPSDAATRAAASSRRPARLDTPFDLRWLWLLAPLALLTVGALGERRRVPRAHGRQSAS